MPLEDLTGVKYVDALNPNWPLGTDEKREGDDHIRGIKNTVQRTLVDGSDNPLSQPMYEVYATLFYLREVFLPLGSIIMWSGDILTPPDKWALCDGTNGLPDLRDRFIRGAGGADAIGDTGGVDQQTDFPEHNHGSGSYATEAHNHDLRASDNNTSFSSSGGNYYAWATTANNDAVGPITNGGDPIQAAGSLDVSGACASAGVAGGVDNRPAYYALAYIGRIA